MLPEDAPALARDQPSEWMTGPKAPRMKPAFLQPLYAPFSAPPHTLPPLTPITKDPSLAFGSARRPGSAPNHSPKHPILLAAVSPLTVGPPTELERMMEGGQQLPHLTFDLQPLLVVLFLILIRRLEDTRAAGQGQLLGMHVVLHLAQWAADEGGPLPSTGEHSRRGTGHTGRGILEGRKNTCAPTLQCTFLSYRLTQVPSVAGGWILSFQHRAWRVVGTQRERHPHLTDESIKAQRDFLWSPRAAALVRGTPNACTDKQGTHQLFQIRPESHTHFTTIPSVSSKPE